MSYSPSSFHGSQWGVVLVLGVVVGEQNLHATSLLAQQYDCAWFTAGDRNDGHPY